MQPKKLLLNKIKDRKAHVAVVGLGYVGLPLALEFVRSGFKTTGIDIASGRIQKVKKGVSYIDDVLDEELLDAKRKHLLSATTNFADLKAADCVVICVPTPLGKTRQPDLSFVLSAVRQVVRFAHAGQLIVLESTTYPGTTDENIRPMLEKPTGLKVGLDIFLGFSPERVDPGNRKFCLKDIPKVIGGSGPDSRDVLKALYGKVFREVVVVTGTRAAEMVKLLENTFRSVNIGLINEMARVCHTLDIDIWEVIRAASTKPFGFMPFYPGPGIGGHCINIDSMYLAWKARLHGFEPRLIELAQQINDEMPNRITERVSSILNERDKPVRNTRILILGAAYKKNVSDIREAPAFAIMERLYVSGAKLCYHDPHVPSIRVNGRVMKSMKLTPAMLKRQDLILLLTDHDAMDYRMIANSGIPVFDTRNAFGVLPNHRKNIIRL